MQDFQTFDLVILAIIVLLGLKGILNGLVKEIFGLIGLVGGVFVASRYSHELGNIVAQFVPFKNPNAISITGFVIGLAMFWFGSLFAGKIISNLVVVSGLGSIDSILGFVAGGGKVFLVFSIIAFISSNIEIINKNSSKLFENSKLYPILVDTGSYIVKLDPEAMVKKVVEEPMTIQQPQQEIQNVDTNISGDSNSSN